MKMRGCPLAVGEDTNRKTWSLREAALSSPGILPLLSEPLTLVARRARGSSNTIRLGAARKTGHWVLRGNQKAGSIPTLESFERLTWLSFHSVGESMRVRRQEWTGRDTVRAGKALRGHLAQDTPVMGRGDATVCWDTAPWSLRQPEPPDRSR